jgi:esterase/lipase superfamily enzyme
MSAGEPLEPPTPPLAAKTVLLLAVDPGETPPEAFEEELRRIAECLQEAAAGRRIEVVPHRGLARRDLAELLLRHRPGIVHFSAYGSPTGEVVPAPEAGRGGPAAPEPVAAELAALLDLLDPPVECVVFDACFAADTAAALTRHAGCVLGTSKRIGDPTALRFAAAFYRGLARGDGYRAAFDAAREECDPAALPDLAVPQYLSAPEPAAPAPIRFRGLEVPPPKPQCEMITTISQPLDADELPALRRELRAALAAEAASPPTGPQLQRVWFGTNRQLADPGDPGGGFSAARDEDAVHYGICDVAVPKAHLFGSVGSPWWRRWIRATDDRLALQRREILAEEAFWLAARREIATWDAAEAMALVFLHGFNVTFDDAAIRAAQLAVDLKIPGLTAFFSWPSQGRLSLRDYTADGASIEASEQQITEFLLGVAATTGSRRVHVIAHSMGNRGLLRAMQAILARAARAAGKPFRQVIFAAPDVDQGSFRQLAAAHHELAERATLYVSSHDRAVASSGLLAKAPRAGFAPPVTVIDGIDTVDVTNADLTLLGHGYYGAAQGVLYDMHESILHGTPPASRTRLTEVPAAGRTGRYWKIGA